MVGGHLIRCAFSINSDAFSNLINNSQGENMKTDRQWCCVPFGHTIPLTPASSTPWESTDRQKNKHQIHAINTLQGSESEKEFLAYTSCPIVKMERHVRVPLPPSPKLWLPFLVSLLLAFRPPYPSLFQLYLRSHTAAHHSPVVVLPSLVPEQQIPKPVPGRQRGHFALQINHPSSKSGKRETTNGGGKEGERKKILPSGGERTSSKEAAGRGTAAREGALEGDGGLRPAGSWGRKGPAPLLRRVWWGWCKPSPGAKVWLWQGPTMPRNRPQAGRRLWSPGLGGGGNAKVTSPEKKEKRRAVPRKRGEGWACAQREGESRPARLQARPSSEASPACSRFPQADAPHGRAGAGGPGVGGPGAAQGLSPWAGPPRRPRQWDAPR